MAFEDYPAISSPRVSFSYNLCRLDKIPSEERLSLPTDQPPPSNSRDDFEFPSSNDSVVVRSLYADELFVGGKILTVEVKQQSEKNGTQVEQMKTPAPAAPHGSTSTVIESTNIVRERSKEVGSKDNGGKNKAFWRIKRSRSLNGVNPYKLRLCFLPLMSRSCSTGSSPSRIDARPGRFDRRSRVSPVSSVASKDVFGLSSLFTSRTSKKVR